MLTLTGWRDRAAPEHHAEQRAADPAGRAEEQDR